ncbi:MAG: hypothetical protein MUW51_11270 [Lactococcus lactis]|nr:hypothetical protein [Lactococcus lactis]
MRFVLKFKNIIKELKEYKQKNLLFIDEIHTIMGAGRSQGAIDAANIIKPALARGEIQLIGATTADEFHDYIEEDEAMERRFQQIIVNEPTVAKAIEIVGAVAKRDEKIHGVKIKPSAIRAAVTLSVRYIPELYLPDKALDLIDIAGAKAVIDGKKAITEREIAGVIQRKKGISLSVILKDDNERLNHVQEILEKHVSRGKVEL